MAGYTSNCACTTTQTTVQVNQANYITLNGRQVLKQYFSQDQGKMVYAHADPSVIGGVIYKAQKPNESTSSVKKTTQSNDAFSSQRQAAIKNSQSSQTRQTQPLSFQKKPGTNDAYLTLPPGRSIILDQENGAGKLIIQNLTDRTERGYAFRTEREAAQSRKNIVIKQSPNRYGGYDYSVIDDTHQYNGKSTEERLYLPENSRRYNKDGNNVRTYKISSFGRASQYLSFPYDDSKQTLRDTQGKIKPRQTIADMQPNLDIDIDPGDSVNYLRPKGLDGSSSTVMIGDNKYEVSNKNDSRFAYIIHKKQEDGSFKPFYAVDPDIKNVKPLDKDALSFNSDLGFKFIETISKEVSVSDQIKSQENPSKFEPQEVQDYKAAKNKLREQSLDTELLTQDQEERIKKLLQEVTYKDNLPVAQKTAILQDLSNKINEIKTEDIAARREKALEQEASSENLFDELFPGPEPVTKAVPSDDLTQKTSEPPLFRMFPEQQNNTLLLDPNFLNPKIDWGQQLKSMQDDARLIFPVK